MSVESPITPPEPDAEAVVRLRWAHRDLVVLPGGGVLLPDVSTLFVADVHLGKPASFRSRGVPVPDGGADRDLDRLAGMARQARAGRLVLLGDLLHDAHGLRDDVLESLRAWRQGLHEVEVILVRGNHDRRAGSLPGDVGITEVEEPQVEDGLRWCHHPPDAPTAGEPPFLAGHLHPVVVLRGRGRSRGRERCRCVHAMPHGVVLPAFGSFTGGHVVRPRRGDRMIAVTPDEAVEITIEA